ncbi:MAG: hypothetical protein GFH27_549311n150 [Chloroflexi bacterium AL-W]|nr:hypothetical protein [Chloroflexi bacterium AL-N1]NOK68672.1 hypothetical protein [Chloroflexi bacterium AL-N10]NOK76158.1 hypothetical protein [Chloroflexi bacterium AL-N5]NOK84205.1 hypothetical protein [Chloroflexi bacterium AL-W]NOK91296.1 hypothetical protein [Chloroflexi bacterium AL-N15]
MCESRAAIEVVSLISVAALAAVLIVISILAVWDDMAYDGCLGTLCMPFVWWLILCVLLAPIGGVLEAYIIRFHGQETQAHVIDHYRGNNAIPIYQYRIEYTYDVPVDRTTCTIVKEYVAITKDTFDRYPAGSSIPVRYLFYNPFISQPTGNERVAIDLLLYMYGTMGFVAIVHTCIEYVKKTFTKSRT